MSLISPMVRTALFVSDIEKSSAFYRDIFDLEEVYAEGGLTHATAAKLLGMPPETNVRYRVFRSAGLNKGMVGLFELKKPSPPRVQKREYGCSIGEACMVFYCANLDVVHDRLIVGSHIVLCPPTHLEVDIEGGAIKSADRGQREMTFRDPDGIMVNLIERDPASQN
ncbi:MAG: VOC family protein [Rhodospirillales bacterium]|jgi:catechol 2,3-dioxygenase-like lactoylglutathione lyase family enzyme